jgi:hypothetical protein
VRERERLQSERCARRRRPENASLDRNNEQRIKDINVEYVSNIRGLALEATY